MGTCHEHSREGARSRHSTASSQGTAVCRLRRCPAVLAPYLHQVLLALGVSHTNELSQWQAVRWLWG
jgi:hypothetical protein